MNCLVQGDNNRRLIIGILVLMASYFAVGYILIIMFIGRLGVGGTDADFIKEE